MLAAIITISTTHQHQRGRRGQVIYKLTRGRPIFLTHLSPHRVGTVLEEVTAKSEAANAQSKVIGPHVYLSWGPKLEAELQAMIQEFSLNEEQARTFAIIARQSCWRHQIAANASMSVADSNLNF